MIIHNPIRITFLTIMPSPYTLDLFAAIEADGRIVPRALYMEMETPDNTSWGKSQLPASAELLAGVAKDFGGGRIHFNPGVVRALRRSRPDLVVVSGYASLTAQIAMRWLRWRRIPWIFWGEVPRTQSASRWRGRLRGMAQYPAIQWPDAIAAMGSVAVQAYRRLAPASCDVANIPYHTDLGPFFDQPRQAAANAVRILFCGQLIERKGVGVLLDSFLAVADESPQSELTFVGEGPLRQSLAERVPECHRARVTFAGFQPVERLPQFFSAADIFVLPSLHDGWGVVVNQALGAGLPIICTSAVGAGTDLVIPGSNGIIVPPADVPALSEALRILVCDREKRVCYGANSRVRARDWTPARGVDRWAELAGRVLARRSARETSLIDA